MTLTRVLPWLALAAAFSPLLVEWAAHLRTDAWARYVLGFVVLTPWAFWKWSDAAPPRRAGFALVIVALMIQLAGIGGEFVRFARPALPLAVIGLCLALGSAPLRVAALAAWCVPVPSLLEKLLGPGFLEGQLSLVGGSLAALGLPLHVEGAQVLSGAEGFALAPGLGGLVWVALLSGLGWLAGLQQGDRGAKLGLRAAQWALAAIPLQLVALALTLLVFATAGLASAESAQAWLPLPVGAGGLALALRRPVHERQTAR